MNSTPLSRRDFNRQLLGSLGGALLAPSIAKAAAANQPEPSQGRRTNIVFLLSDQHNAQCAGFMGHPLVRTPNLDRIAQQGAVFRNAYCGSPVCTPSRAGLLSGCYPSDVNSFCNSTAWNGQIPAWPALLRDAGYRTFGCGKMDADDRHDIGFTESVLLGNEHATKPDITAFFRRPLCTRLEERDQVNGATRAQPYASDAHHVDAIVDFIKKQQSGGQPWAAYAGFHMPHPSFVGLREHFDYYLSRVDLPNVPAGHLEQIPTAYQQLRNFKNIATPIAEERVRRARAAYFAMITELDGFIGRVWSAVEASGQLENTIFIYASDHGESLGEHGLWFKNNLYESSARVPLVMSGPGVPKGKVIETPVAHVDLTRTLVEWGGAKAHSQLRGHSLTGLLRAERGDHPGWAYSESHSEGNPTGSFMIRKGDWKYLHFAWYGDVLFNVADDPGELRDRVNDPAAAGVLAELKAILATQVDPLEVTERAFKYQRQRLDSLAAGLSESQMVNEFRNRLGEGQAVALLTAYYGRTFPYEHKVGKLVPSGYGG